MPEYDHEDLTINPTQVFSAHNWVLKANQLEGPPFTDYIKVICNIIVLVDSKAPTTSSKTKMKVPQGKKPGAKSGLRRNKSSKHTSESKTEASKSKTGHSNNETQSSSAKDKIPSHPSASTPVVSEIYKEAHQAASGPTFFHFHSKFASGCDASADSTAEVDPGISAPNDFIPEQQGMDEGTQNYSLNHISVNLLQSQKDTLEQQKEKAEAEVAFLKARPLYPDINQLTELLVTSLKPELTKLLALHDFASCLPTELKELPSKITKLSGAVKELKKHVRDMEIELPTIQWALPAEFLVLPKQKSSVQEKLKTLDALPSLLTKVTATLNRFATIMENASSGATGTSVPSACKADASPAEGEKNTNPTTKDANSTNLKDKLIDLLGIYVGPITLKIYREDGTVEVISNFKVSDLHLAEWREVVQACPDKKEKGWKTIYGLIKTRMEYLNQTEKELKIDFNKPLKEQDPLNELNDLANKKRKRTSDLKDHSRSTKRYKSSIQHEEEVH
ncbi:hypothetical protein Tco_0116760 [Tanacetum coccineum]